MHICVFADFDDEKGKGKKGKERKERTVYGSLEGDFFSLLTECIGSKDGQI